MFSNDRGSALAPHLDDAEILSPAIPASAAPFEKCAACGTICRPTQSPQLLPCLHSVCKVCLSPVDVEEGKRECPNCRRPYDILEVMDNPLLKDSTTGPSTHRLAKCAGCEDTTISGCCVECGEALCSICVSAHQRVRVTREHTVLPQKLPTGFIPTLFCPIHREEPMKLFCVSCNQLTCRDCQLTFHRNHSYQFLNEAVTAQREQIESLMERVKQQRAVVKQTLLDLDGRLQDVEEMKSKAKCKLQKMLLHVRYALMKRASELFKSVQDLCGCEAQKITERQNNLRTLEERQEYILSFTERALQMENHSALLSCKKQVQSQLQDLLSQCATPPASMIDVRLHFDQQAYCQIATIGTIVTDEVPFLHKNHDAPPKKSSLPPVPRQNVHPAPSSYQPYPSAFPAPSPSHSSLPSPQIAPTSACSPSVSPAQSSAVTAHAPFASVSRPSTTASPLPSVYSSSPCTPPPPYHIVSQISAPSPPAPLLNPLKAPSQPSRQRRSKQTWSFHPYQPKNYKPSGLQPNACSPEPPQQPAGVRPPASSESRSPPVSVLAAVPPLLGPNAKTGPPAAPREPWPESPPMEPAEFGVPVWPDREEQQPKAPPCVLAVKAPADSPCERAPPAGCERAADPSPPATENEPTSTVTETDAALSAGRPDAGLAASAEKALAWRTSTEISAGVPAASRHAGAVPEETASADGTAGHAPSLPSVGPSRRPPPAAGCAPAFSRSLQKQPEVKVQSCPHPHHTSTQSILTDSPSVQFSNQKSSKPAKEPYFQPIKMQHEEGKGSGSRNSDSKSTASQQAPPSRACPIPIPVRPLEKCKEVLPTSLKEMLEMPSPNLALGESVPPDKNPLLRQLLLNTAKPESVPAERTGYRGSPVETEKTDDDEDGEGNFGLGPKTENDESGGPVSRPWLPLVSVMRLPISVPSSGQPLPQFRLLPGTTEDEILLQIIEDDEPVSQPEGPSLRPAHKAAHLRCAACRVAGALSECAHCGRGFHRDCHIPPLGSASSEDWQCMLCRDLSDVGDLYSDERPRRPSLSLPDQRKCEHVLLALMCKKYSSVLYRKVELSSHYIDITLIRGRLLQKLSPPYRTPSEFVSDIWVLLETLSKNSEETGLVFRMQKYFQRKLRKTFGDALHPSLLKCPGAEDGEAVQDQEDETGKVRETLKRMREFLAANHQALAKKVCKDERTEPKEKSQA